MGVPGIVDALRSMRSAGSYGGCFEKLRGREAEFWCGSAKRPGTSAISRARDIHALVIPLTRVHIFMHYIINV